MSKKIFFTDIFKCRKCNKPITETAYFDAELGWICEKCAWGLDNE